MASKMEFTDNGPDRSVSMDDEVNKIHLSRLEHILPQDADFITKLGNATSHLVVSLVDFHRRVNMKHSNELVKMVYEKFRLLDEFEANDDEGIENDEQDDFLKYFRRRLALVLQDNSDDSAADLIIDENPHQYPEKYKSTLVFEKSLLMATADAKREMVSGVTILGEELFAIIRYNPEIDVFDLNNLEFKLQFLQKLNDPIDIVASNNCLYIFDQKKDCGDGRAVSNEILRCDNRGGIIVKWSTGFVSKGRLSITTNGNVLMTAYMENILHEFTPEGCFIRTIILPERISEPTFAKEVSDGDFLVTSGEEYKNWRFYVARIDASKQIKKMFGGHSGCRPFRAMHYLSDLAIDSDGFILVCDKGKARILLFDSELKLKKIVISKKTHPVFDNMYRILLDETRNRLLVLNNVAGVFRVLAFRFQNESII